MDSRDIPHLTRKVFLASLSLRPPFLAPEKALSLFLAVATSLVCSRHEPPRGVCARRS